MNPLMHIDLNYFWLEIFADLLNDNKTKYQNIRGIVFGSNGSNTVIFVYINS